VNSVARHPWATSELITDLLREARTFREVERRIAALPTEVERGAVFEVFAEAWLTTQRLPRAREVWPSATVPLSLQEKLRLPLKDMGVDGVFETYSDEAVCYQVKFRSERPSLNWTELSKFFGLADFAHSRLLFTNCDDVSKIAENRRDAVFIRGGDLDTLTADDLETIERWLSQQPAAAAKKVPRPDQQRAVDEIARAFDRKARATALRACGTGKTLIALWLAERLEAQKVLVLVPSLALLAQTLREWLHETRWQQLDYRCVCSDKTVDTGNDELIVRPSDIPFRVSTQSADVRSFLTSSFPGVKLVFSTYQSSAVVAEGARGLEPFDVAIFDEAHKTAGREGTKLSLALSDVNMPAKRRLFLTATPRHYKVEQRDKSGDAKLVYSMDVPEVYGPVVHRLPFSEASELDIITDYRVLVSVVTSEMVTNELLRRGVVLVEGEEIKAQQVANQIAVRSAIETYGAQKVFTFHSRVASARSFTSRGPEGIQSHLAGFQCAHINGAMPTAQRERLMREFASAPRALLSNARCLTEGVDLPAVDMVAFLSPRRSLVDIVQAVGRAMRKSPGKSVGYVLVPLYVEQARNESLKEAVLRSDFDEVWLVLQRLKEHDDLLAQIIADMRMERGKTGGFDDSRFREKVHVLGPEVSLEDLRRYISSACIDAIGESWFERYGELLSYKEEFGNCDVPKRMRERKKLANWVVQQRVGRNAGRLSEEKIALLDRLGFKWHPGGHRWRENYLALVEFKQRFNHCRVPQEWPENKRLATWVCTQRLRRKAGALSQERVRALDKLDFDWQIDVTTWDERFAELCAFKQRFGHTRVNVKWPENPRLGAWVVDQRHRRRQGRLNPVHERCLNEIGFEWDVLGPDRTRWEKHFNELLALKDRNYQIRSHDNQSLLEWMQRQRRLYRSGRYPKDLEERLNAIGFPWNPSRSKTWEQMLAELVAHYRANGSCNFSNKLPGSRSLKHWCTVQRKLHRTGKLTRDQISKLEAIGFDWRYSGISKSEDTAEQKIQESGWERMFSQLVEYYKIHGDFNVPQHWQPNPALGRWVGSQRSAWRQKQLSRERKRRLEAIGFNWRVHDDTWENTFERARPFFTNVQRNGSTASVPRKLRAWMVTQRLQKKSGKLDVEREKRLSEAGFEWEPHEFRWKTFYAQLQQFHREHRHCRVPADWRPNRPLAHWVAVQRASFKAGQLSAERTQALNDLGFTWSVERTSRHQTRSGSSASDWRVMFAKVEEFKRIKGHFAFPQKTPLADWAIKQRILRRNKQIDPECERALNQIGFDWDPINNRWERMFVELLEFKKKHGHVNVPQKSRKYPKLAAWVAKQRFDKKKKRAVLAGRADRLDELGFTWAFSPVATWEQRFDELVAYRQAHGDCKVPQHWKENKQLGKWVNTQRTQLKRGKLSAERKAKLDSIGFVWDTKSKTRAAEAQLVK
jgi:superfamily II DNA or RNA helicase